MVNLQAQLTELLKASIGEMQAESERRAKGDHQTNKQDFDDCLFGSLSLGFCSVCLRDDIDWFVCLYYSPRHFRSWRSGGLHEVHAPTVGQQQNASNTTLVVPST
jgi:hypothetical protein